MRRLAPMIALAGALTLAPSGFAADEPPYSRQEDVIYGRKFGTALTMDILRPREHPNGLGAILVVSGGWYSGHEVIDSPLFAGMVGDLSRRGYTVFAVVHGSQPKFTIPEILQDLNRAVRFIRHHAKEYKIDPDRLGIYGASAGGHLSLMQGTAGDKGDPDAKDPVDRESSRVQAVACFFPPTDFLNYGKEGEDALGRGTLKDFKAPFDFHELDPKTRSFVPVTDEAKVKEIGRQIAPMTHATADDPPTLIIHGDADKLVPIQQAEILVKKLKEAGVDAKLVVKPGASHGWPDLPKDVALIADWFDAHLKPEGKPTDAKPDEGKPRSIAPGTAKDHIGERVTVEMAVRLTKDAAGREEYYLDSEEDFRDPKNCAIVIPYAAADKFKAAGIDDPSAYYKGKTIRVTGTLIREANQNRIRVEAPAQIEVVATDPAGPQSRADRPPRKVVVGTVIFGPYGAYPGLEARLKELTGFIDAMAREAARAYPGRGLDLAVLPETCVTSNLGPASARAVPLEGPVTATFGALAREHRTYILAPLEIAEEGPKGTTFANAAVLFDRRGEVAGIYRKAHPVAFVGRDDLEDGIIPGREYPVFDCDFGKLGVQICWDIQFDDGWDALARKGAELVAWPSASPATVQPSARAARHRYYVVSSTWREDATIFEPTGMVAAQVERPGAVLVHQLDLSYAILGWSSPLQNGKALTEKYGDGVGYHYSPREDLGLFWSNDPATTIGAMIRSLGLEEIDAQVARNRRLHDAARGGPAD